MFNGKNAALFLAGSVVGASALFTWEMSLLVNKRTIGTVGKLLKELTTETVAHSMEGIVSPIRPFPTTPTL